MKRIFSAVLLAGLILGICACGGNGETIPEPKALLVGFGRVDITPEMSVPLAGYGQTEKRMSIVAREPLYATCIAVTGDDGETLLLISQDLIDSTWGTEARAAVSNATAVPEDHIMVAGTHTHSAPDIRSTMDCIQAYKQSYLKNVAAAAAAAMEDRSEAFVYTARTDLEKMNGVRHYLMEDGSYAGDNFGSFKNNTIVEPAEEKDDDLQVIRFAREGKQDVVMVNWQAHPSKNGSSTSYLISADFIGDARSAFEQSSGQLFVYFTGAAGNLNPSSHLESECTPMDCTRYGQRLAQAVTELLQDMQTPVVTSVKTAKSVYTGQLNHDMEDKLEQARQIQQIYGAEGKAAADTLVKEHGFAHVYHALAVIRRSEYGKTQDIELNVASFGGVSFVAAPYEMFAVHGNYIKEHSPADMTFVITCCNGHHGYLPSTLAYDYNSYEAYNGNFARGTGDEVAKLLVEMLKEMK